MYKKWLYLVEYENDCVCFIVWNFFYSLLIVLFKFRCLFLVNGIRGRCIELILRFFSWSVVLIGVGLGVLNSFFIIGSSFWWISVVLVVCLFV